MAEDFLKEKIDMMGEGLEYMDKILTNIDEVCLSLRKNEKLEMVPQISEGLVAIVQVVNYTHDLNKIDFDEKEVYMFISEMVEGMENGDINLVADILEYEIKPMYQYWADSFADVIEQYV